jgi:hypothetical protein
MLCDVRLLLGESVQARYELIGTRAPNHGVKIGSKMAALSQVRGWGSPFWKVFRLFD